LRERRRRTLDEVDVEAEGEGECDIPVGRCHGGLNVQVSIQQSEWEDFSLVLWKGSVDGRI